ncbi:transmembrane 4 L6 family member 1-like [Varanus komodoensis]|uniref:transmembrane 4 L6 family member 1-like n=1 Tax=Varanus komodoensis TaxID=61221 RepID=UPI001CF7C390|nr:transmembrane 4 L6 family member 1-like [Varanus komodoensis]
MAGAQALRRALLPYEPSWTKPLTSPPGSLFFARLRSLRTAAMCTGKCSKVVGAALWPFALLCITVNILLAFPDWKTEYVHDWGSHLTPEVLYLGGLVGGGVMVLVPAVHIQATGSNGCCGNRCGMCLSVLFAVMGVVGAVYAVGVSMLGLVHGPLCRYEVNGTLSDWGRPFLDSKEPFSGGGSGLSSHGLFCRPGSEQSYLFDTSLWNVCVEPHGVIQFNVILFSLMLCSGLVELCLCITQVFNGFFGCICGTCADKTSKHPVRSRLPWRCSFPDPEAGGRGGPSRTPAWPGGAHGPQPPEAWPVGGRSPSRKGHAGRASGGSSPVPQGPLQGSARPLEEGRLPAVALSWGREEAPLDQRFLGRELSDASAGVA